MPHATDIRIVNATYETERIGYRTPIKFGGRVVGDAVIANVAIEVEDRQGRRASGTGSMPLGNVWAWPSEELGADQTLTAMDRMAVELVLQAGTHEAFGHPLDLTTELAKAHQTAADRATDSLAETMPVLAQRVVASPIEAAIHDAYGCLHGQNAYNLLGPEYVNFDLAHYLTPEFAGEYLDRYTLRDPKPSIPLYHLVGALDPLSQADVSEPVGDGLPETLLEWITTERLTHLKIKLAGDNLDWDIDRVVAVNQVADEAQREARQTDFQFSLDFNERCQSVEYVLEFLARIREIAPAAFNRVQYIEQPTHRDLRRHPENKMHEAAKIKPVVIDESLVDLDSLLLSRELGYSGVALKACKGHTEALLMGAAAQKFGMFLCVQDLTCPGASFLHSASIAARLPTVAAIEGNGRQYCPAGNSNYSERFPGMFRISDGTVATAELSGVGLGF